jgi:hypothetical protein
MRKIVLALLLLLVGAAPAFAIWPLHKKPPRDPRMGVHPKAYHEKNLHHKERIKVKPHKHNA